MKRIVLTLTVYLGCMGVLWAQNIWKPINVQGSFVGVSSDGSIYTFFDEYGGYSGISRSQDEGETWQVVLSSETEPNLRFISDGWTFTEEGRIYVLAEHYEGEEWDGTYYLFYSDNNGDSWQQHSVLDGLSEFGGITAPTNDIIVYWSEGGWSMGGDYMWTVDGGVNWHHTFFAPPHDEVPGHLPHLLTHVIVNASGDLYASYLCYCQSPAAIACAHISNTTSSWEGGLLLDGKVVRDMDFDSDGNALICYTSSSSSVEYFQEKKDKYFVFSGPCLAVSDNDVVYTMRRIDDTHVVLNYSQHYGEHFFDVGDTLTVNSSANLFLYKGRDNQLYFRGQGTHFWKSIPNANDIPSLNNWLGGCFFDDDSGLKYIITDPVDHTVEVTWHADPYQRGDYRIPSTVSYKGTTYTVTGIGKLAFCGIDYLSEVSFVDIPETVTYIDDQAFYYCMTLDSINIPNAVTSIGKNAFEYCKNLDTVFLPNSAVSIGAGAFEFCVGLKSVHLPDSLEVIESTLFSNCDSLKSIILPETVSIIKKEAFADCNSLSEIVIPQNVETIGTNAFRWCGNLSRVELGKSVSLIGDHAFWHYSPNDKLTVICHNPIPAQCSATTFSNAEYQEKVIVPCGCEEAYHSAWAECWSSDNFEEDCSFVSSEWYYEILNDDGNITYQYLQHSNDTTIQDEPVQIIVKINTLYDKVEHIEKSFEYIYERDGRIYWWNKTSEEFTVLYDYNAQIGSEWEIKVGTESLVMHVDTVDLYEYEGRQYKMLQVSDTEDLFSGTIVCGIGHLTSFFPEKLLNQSKSFRVEGIRCFWQNGELLFKYGDRDCDEVYEEFHDYGVDEPSLSRGFMVYPNPTDGVFTLKSANGTQYHITNIMGQVLMSGTITSETEQIDVSSLSEGMYFIFVGSSTAKLIKR